MKKYRWGNHTHATSAGVVGFTTLTLGVALMPASSFAAEADTAVLQEVIVTATKREESVLKVPLSVAVIDSAQIEQLGARDMEDLSRSVPGLIVQKNCEQCNGKTFIFRGIAGSGDTALSSVYLDDTPLTFGSSSPDLNLIDVQRIEVLRGPQGTLFGSSSMSGAIRYVSPDPNYQTTSGFTKLELTQVDGGGMGYEVEAVGGTPLIDDKLAVRTSLFKRRDGGYIDQVDEFTGAVVRKNENSDDSYGGRFALAGRQGPLEAIASVVFQKEVDHGLDTYSTLRGVDPAVPIPPFETWHRLPTFRRSQTALPNLTLKGDVGFADVISSTSYLRRIWYVQTDFSSVVQNILGCCNSLLAPNIQSDTDTAFSQEIRLASKSHDNYDWLVGGFYRTTKEISRQTVPSNLGDVLPEFEPQLLPGGVTYDYTGTSRRRQLAFFGEASYRPVAKLKLTVGERYSNLSRSTYGVADGIFNGGRTVRNVSSSEHGVSTPKGSISYDVGPNTMAYVTVAKGFREGGSNPIVPLGRPECVAALALLGRTNVPPGYDSDSLTSYEFGLKGRTDNQRFTYQADVYQVNWAGIQSGLNLGGGCNFGFTANLGAARSRGGELETSWRPFDRLSLGLNLGYTTTELTEDQIAGTDANGPVITTRKGTPLTDFPRWIGSTWAQYDLLVTERWRAFARGDLQYVGNSTLYTPFTINDTLDNYKKQGYRAVSTRIGANTGPYEFAVFIQNLTNTRPLIYNAISGNAQSLQTITPRYFGVSALWRF